MIFKIIKHRYLYLGCLSMIIFALIKIFYKSLFGFANATNQMVKRTKTQHCIKIIAV